MNLHREVNQFISHGKSLYQRLRANGQALSDVDLVSLREQLFILDKAAGHLQESKEFQFDSDEPFIIFHDEKPHLDKHMNRRHHG